MQVEQHQILLAIPAVWIAFSLLRGFRAPKLVFLSVFSGAFFIANYLGLLLPADTLAGFAGYDISEVWLMRSGLAYLPFLGVIALASRLEGMANRNESGYVGRLSGSGVVVCMAGLLAASVMVVIYLANGGMEHAYLWNAVSDIDSAYKIRYDAFAEKLRFGLSSSMAAFGIIPTLGAVLLVTKNFMPLYLRLAVVALPFGLAFIRSLAILQRGAPVVQIVTISIIILIAVTLARGSGVKRLPLTRLAIAFSLGVIVFLLAGVTVFERTGALDSALYRVVERVIAIPAHTGALYFGYFPDYLQFRGFPGTFFMPIGEADDYLSGEVSIKLIGFLANGYPHNANANFIASAYSGAGSLSVAVISGLMLGVCIWFSRLIGRYGFKFALAISVAQMQGIYFLTQADFAASLTAGFWVGFIIIWVMSRAGFLIPEAGQAFTGKQPARVAKRVEPFRVRGLGAEA